MTFAERLKKDTLMQLENTVDKLYAEFDFNDKDEEHCIEELTDLAMKLGTMTGKLANVMDGVRGAFLIGYVQNNIALGALQQIDINKDFAKLVGDDEDEDEDDDDESIEDIIDKVLKELRNK